MRARAVAISGAALCEGMLSTGGDALSIDDATIVRAHAHAHEQLGVTTCHTGAAGLAALIREREATGSAATGGAAGPPDVVVLSGLDRQV